MSYPFDPKDTIHLWLPAFLALSIEFEGCAEDLHFPVEMSEDVRQVAKEFSLLALSAMGRNVPEMPPQISTSTSSTEIGSLFPAWEYTFSRLEIMGCAQAIYDWGYRMQRDHIQFDNQLIIAHASSILPIHWSLDSINPIYLPLELDQEIIKTIQLIVLRHYTKYLQFKDRM